VAALREDLVAALLKPLAHDGRVAVAESPDAGACAPLADRVALTIPKGHAALARAASGSAVVEIAARAYGSDAHVGEAAKRAAEACGGAGRGTRGEGRATVPAAEETRFRKLFAEGFA